MPRKRRSKEESGNDLMPLTEESTIVKRFATIDVEAQAWINYVVGGIYDGEEFYQTKYLTSLISQCFTISKRKGISDFYAHFGGKYDFLFFLQEAILNNQYKILNIIPRGSGILQFEVEMDRNHCRENDLDYIKGKIVFRDSSALLPFSLAAACDSFNVPTVKTYFDYNFVEHSYKNIDYLPDIWERCDYEIYYEKIITDDYGNEVVTYSHTISQWYEWVDEEEYESDVTDLEGITYGTEILTRKVKKYHHCIEDCPDDYEVSKVRYRITSDKKADFLHKIYNRADIIEYLRIDLVALHECLTRFYDWDLVKKVGPASTVAGQALRVLRWFLKDPLISIVRPDETESQLDRFVRRGYFGGRTEIFRPLYQAENEGDRIACYDFNSLYPTVMRNAMPNRFKKWSTEESDFEKEEFAFWECDVEVPADCYYPVLGTEYIDEKKNKRFIFPTGKFSGVWPANELKYAITQGTKITKFRMGAIFESGGEFFTPFINTLYQMRLDAKAKGDPVGDVMCKLLMNSCYGKTGIDVFDKENLIVADEGTAYDVGFEIQLDTNLYASLVPIKVKLDKSFNNVAIAAWVTALARIKLHKAIASAGIGNVYYCDTDSVFTSKELPTGKQLGDLKEEYVAKDAVFLLPKTYIINQGIDEKGKKFNKKVTMKGFDKKKVANFQLEDFQNALEGDLKALRTEEVPRVATFKTALQYGEFLMLKNDPATMKRLHEKMERQHFERTGKRKRIVREEYKLSERAIKSSYNKRVIIKEGWDTKPVHINTTKETPSERQNA